MSRIWRENEDFERAICEGGTSVLFADALLDRVEMKDSCWLSAGSEMADLRLKCDDAGSVEIFRT